MQDYYDEQEIDLLDLLYKISINIKKIVIVSIAFGVLFGIYKGFVLNNENQILKEYMLDKTSALEKYNGRKEIEYIESVDKYIEDALLIDSYKEETKLLELTEENLTTKEKVHTLYTNNEKIKNEFNSIQQKYYSHIKENKLDRSIDIKDMIKFILIGSFCGLFISCAYYGMIYILNGKIHTKDDLKYLNIKLLGVLYTNKENNSSIKKIFKKEYIDLDESLNIVNEKIKLDKKTSKSKSAVLATTLKEDEIKDIIINISKKLNIKNIYYEINKNSNFIKDLNSKDIVLIETLEKTKNNDLREIRDLVNDYKLNLLGSILIDNE